MKGWLLHQDRLEPKDGDLVQRLAAKLRRNICSKYRAPFVSARKAREHSPHVACGDVEHEGYTELEPAPSMMPCSRMSARKLLSNHNFSELPSVNSKALPG